MSEPQYVVLAGNLSDGYRAVGPFADFDTAADSPEAQDPWSWVMTLEEPK